MFFKRKRRWFYVEMKAKKENRREKKIIIKRMSQHSIKENVISLRLTKS